jgi:hypothetical protein
LCPGGYRDSRALCPQAALGLIKPRAVRPDVRPCKATSGRSFPEPGINHRPAVGGFQVIWELCVPGAARLAHAKTEFNGTGGLLTYIGLVPAVS